MKTSAALLAAPALLLAAAAGVLLAQEELNPDGLPDMAGTWEGKIRTREYAQFDGGDSGREAEKIEIEVVQDAEALTATLTYPDDPGAPSLTLYGAVGDGVFWLKGTTTGFGHTILVWGRVRGPDEKLRMKGEGTAVYEASVEQVSFAAVRSATD